MLKLSCGRCTTTKWKALIAGRTKGPIPDLGIMLRHFVVPDSVSHSRLDAARFIANLLEVCIGPAMGLRATAHGVARETPGAPFSVHPSEGERLGSSTAQWR